MSEVLRTAEFVAFAGAAAWATGWEGRALRGVVLLFAASGIGLLVTEGSANGLHLEVGDLAHVVSLVLCVLLTLVAAVGFVGAPRIAPAAALLACAAFWIGVVDPVPLWFAPLPFVLVALGIRSGAGSETARALGARLVVAAVVITAPAVVAAAVLAVEEARGSGVPVGLLWGILVLLPASHLVAVRALHRPRAVAPVATPVSAPS